jgi:hypothetical protein
MVALSGGVDLCGAVHSTAGNGSSYHVLYGLYYQLGFNSYMVKPKDFERLKYALALLMQVLVQRGHTARKEITVMAQTPLSILFVDDSTADRTLYRHFLSSTGVLYLS